MRDAVVQHEHRPPFREGVHQRDHVVNDHVVERIRLDGTFHGAVVHAAVLEVKHAQHGVARASQLDASRRYCRQPAQRVAVVPAATAAVDVRLVYPQGERHVVHAVHVLPEAVGRQGISVPRQLRQPVPAEAMVANDPAERGDVDDNPLPLEKVCVDLLQHLIPVTCRLVGEHGFEESGDATVCHDHVWRAERVLALARLHVA
mmetsp:Transcript_34180/g.81341  ORF Transcript_34180/g.81341 Transcript_34180/m.81341 type:complete len:203 (+) Transcript_34180:336-944(+)